MSAWMDWRLASAYIVARSFYIPYSRVFHTGPCSVSLNIPTPKLEALEMDSNTHNGDFLENGSNDFDYISIIYGDHVPK
jgi:hypothetical protein